MQRRAIILFIRDERDEAALKPLPPRFRAHGYGALNRSAAAAINPLLTGADLVVVSGQRASVAGALHVIAQRGASFGERIANAVADSFALGYAEAVVIGNDCPAMNARDIDAAFDCLADAPYSAAPTFDGGAFAIGVARAGFDATAFSALPWQTSALFPALIELGAITAAAPRRDFDSWDSADGIRALSQLLDQWSTPGPISIAPPPVISARRAKALSRIHLPAPPAVPV